MRQWLAAVVCALGASPALADVAQTCPATSGVTCVANGLDLACQVDPHLGTVSLRLVTAAGNGTLVTTPMTRSDDCTYVGQTSDGRYRVEALGDGGRVVGQVTRGFSTEPAVPRPATPPVSALRVTGEVLGGAGVAFVGAIVGGAVGYQLLCNVGDCSGDEYAALGATVTSGAIGAAVMFPLGVYLAGSIGPRGGSLAMTYAGAAIGALVATPFLATGEAPAAVGLLTYPLGAILGFELSRRWDHAENRPAMGALLDVQQGTLRIGVPLATRDRTRDATFVSLAAGTF